MNMFLDNDNIYTLRGVAPYPSFLRLSLAQQPSTTFLLYETSLNPYNAYGQRGYPGTVSCTMGLYPNDGPENFGDRHAHAANKLGGNIVFLDGHVEWRDHLWNPAYPDPSFPPTTDREWWPY
jgi:prepilin-type processing-associated H-X9-DG protein